MILQDWARGTDSTKQIPAASTTNQIYINGIIKGVTLVEAGAGPSENVRICKSQWIEAHCNGDNNCFVC